MDCSGSAAESGIVEVERVALARRGVGAHGDNVKLVLPRQIARFESDKLILKMTQEFRVQNAIKLLIRGGEERPAFFGDCSGENKMILGRRLGRRILRRSRERRAGQNNQATKHRAEMRKRRGATVGLLF